MIKRPRKKKPSSLAEVLDRLLKQGANETSASFRRLVEAARLDPSCDFVGASLPNIDMRDEDLRGFDFSGADLTGADFRRANVQGVRFENANLTGVIGLHDVTVARSARQVSDIGKALAELSALLGEIIGEKTKLLIVQAADVWPVKLESSLFEKFVVNLVGNASDAMPGGGTITIRMSNAPGRDISYISLKERIGDFVEMDVTGISRAQSSQTHGNPVGQGTGSSLSDVNDLVKKMNGSMFFETIGANESRIRILIPRAAGNY